MGDTTFCILCSLRDDGHDWMVVFNSKTTNNMSFRLVQNLPHQSVVCCVRFSACGTMLATGSNKSAQIFDVESGQKLG